MNQLILDRLANLRKQMEKAGVQACFISGTDPHQSEYMPLHWQTRAYISGFTGSAGMVAVTMNQAALWTDSRYFLQATQQMEGTNIQLMKMRIEGTPSPARWLGQVLGAGATIGVDAELVAVSQYNNLKKELLHNKQQLKNTGDLLNAGWTNRPPLPETPVFEHELNYAGYSRLEKINQIRKGMKESGASATIVSALDDLAWTFNLRGQDVNYNPVFLGYALITEKEVQLFINPAKLPTEIREKLHHEEIQLKDYSEIYSSLKKLKGPLLIDPDRVNQLLIDSLPTAAEVIEQVSIPDMLKAIKSEVEIANFRKTMLLDGIAMVDFLFWLDHTIGQEKVDEYEVALKLDYFRSLQKGYRGISFFPIIGYNKTGAIVHRTVTKETANPVKREGMLLFDSGGQYLSGTTDITRTIILSEPSGQQQKDFTITLKGVIGMTNARFPEGTKGCNIDLFARKAMWENGMNYGHGTCHGIGYFLNVHEGPMSIRQEYNEHPICPGMVLSNEPAFYREGQYGLRTENVMLCVEKEITEYGRFLGFETLTLCPIDKKLITKKYLTADEVDWINNYHQRVYRELSPLIDSAEKLEFLKNATEPI